MNNDALALLLKSFRLGTMAAIYEGTLQQAEQQNWGYRKFLLHLCESEAQTAATQTGAAAQAIGPAARQRPGQPGGNQTARQSAPDAAQLAGRRLCPASRERHRHWPARRAKAIFWPPWDGS